MRTEEQAITIAQYADGTLPAAERARVETILATDAELQAFFGEEQALTALLRSEPLPEMDWDALSVRFSNAIPVDFTLGKQLDRRVDRLRDSSATPYLKFGSLVIPLHTRAIFAAAASFIVGLGLATYMMRPTAKPIANNTNDPMPVVDPQMPTAVAVVDGPREDQPIGRAVEEISIGPGGTYANSTGPSPYSDEISARPARVMIAAEAPAEARSTPTSPF